MSIDDIKDSTDTVMTAELVRLFKFAGCYPTACHACKKKIAVGDTFKLVPHIGTDEMCCAKCGPIELGDRDRRRTEAEDRRQPPSRTRLGGWASGYSRPSRASDGREASESKAKA